MSHSRNHFGVCGMCSARCLTQMEVQDDRVLWIQGNPHGPAGSALCARGVAAMELEQDNERPLSPLVRAGARGEGKWRETSWDEALDHVSASLTTIMAKNGGPRSVLVSDRGGPFSDLVQAFARGLGTPNYTNHDAACDRNVQHACRSVLGLDSDTLVNDYRESKHIILQNRNVFEALNPTEVNEILDAKAKGCKLTVIDVRASVSAAKADHAFLIRPGTDYAFNLAVIHCLISEGLYNKPFAASYIDGFEPLRGFTRFFTPQWAEAETGISAERLIRFVHEIAKEAPRVIWHPGWFTARYKDSFMASRTTYIINALLGSIGAKGGLLLGATPKDVGHKGLNKFSALFPKPRIKRADGVGWKYPHFDQSSGLLHKNLEVIDTATPYALRAYISFCHNIVASLPDPETVKNKLNKLDLLVAVTTTWSDTAWFADVVLPLSPCLSRDSILGSKNGLKPYFFQQLRALEPRFNTRSEWEIISGLAAHLGLPQLAFKHIEDLWLTQLEGTNFALEDFKSTGFVSLTDRPFSRSLEHYAFPTPTGKIEMISHKWSEAGADTLTPYVAPPPPPPGSFRLVVGRTALHTQTDTVNNALLAGMMPKNELWLHVTPAASLGVTTGDTVRMTAVNGHTGLIKVFVTPCIHPEAVFMVHGFGHHLPPETRSFGKGLADQEFMSGGLEMVDLNGGGLALQSHFVSLRKAETAEAL